MWDLFIIQLIYPSILSCGFEVMHNERTSRDDQVPARVHEKLLMLVSGVSQSAEQRSTNLSVTSNEDQRFPGIRPQSTSGPPLRSSGGDRRPQAALLQLGYHQHVFEVCRVVVKRLDQSVRLLPLRAVEQLHLIGQALSLVDGLGRRRDTRFNISPVIYINLLSRPDALHGQ